jgi:hypothetical protein
MWFTKFPPKRNEPDIGQPKLRRAVDAALRYLLEEKTSTAH